MFLYVRKNTILKNVNFTKANYVGDFYKVIVQENTVFTHTEKVS